MDNAQRTDGPGKPNRASDHSEHKLKPTPNEPLKKGRFIGSDRASDRTGRFAYTQSGRLGIALPLRKRKAPAALFMRRSAGRYRHDTEDLISKSIFTTMLSGMTVGALAIALFIFVLAAGIGGVYQYFVADLPSLDQLALSDFQTNRIYDRNGTLLYELVDQETGRRTYEPLSNISPNVITATIGTEDKTFYDNPGVDLQAIFRASYKNFLGDATSGASTITQQLVRNVLIRSEKYEFSLKRKAREALLAYQLNKKYTKDQILEMYLNEVFYGNRAYGIEGAAEAYFDKSAKDLTLPEATFLAGLPQSPTAYDPRFNMDAANTRHQEVVNIMVKNGFLTQDGADQIMATPLQFKFRDDTVMKAPHFVFYVIDYLTKKYGQHLANAGGWNIYTTLDLRYQDMAQQMVVNSVNRLRGQNVSNGDAVVMRPGTGEILAMVGSANFYDDSIDGKVNVTLRPRQPGSSFKPFTYATAFMRGMSPATKIADSPISIKIGSEVYSPKNYDNGYHGVVSAREGLANSFNIPAVKSFLYAGLQETLNTAHAMGITTLNDTQRYGPALTLGGGEVYGLDMAVAFSTFANGGARVDANPILKIVDNSGKVVEQIDPNNIPRTQAISPQIAYLITSILSDNQARTRMFGPNSPLKVSRPAAAKTGTTNDYRDSWTIGYTPYLTVQAWMGNSNNAQMGGVAGAIGAGYIFHDIMEGVFSNPDLLAVLKGPDGKDPPMDFSVPEGIVHSNVCGRDDVFIDGNVPKSCPTLTLNKDTINWTGLVVSSSDPASKPAAKKQTGQ